MEKYKIENLQTKSVHSQAAANPSHNVNIGDFEGKDVTVIENQNVDVFGDYPVIVQSDTSTPNVTGVGGENIESFQEHVSGGSSTTTSPASSRRHSPAKKSGADATARIQEMAIAGGVVALVLSIKVSVMIAIFFFLAFLCVAYHTDDE